ncbi:sulfurtransferase TusA family protein [Ciceribacter sp. L1K23]|uniref:sulfurtransferase TusA family protein n=1 Tax=Ciceribacter sp. L1K23 TaxID=2820276 RepID=UPI001B83642A|nr:sulfurtransferase TusA family protein [Ciceribacter sp. L1K23]MBR0554219.1 sulfurtransferase TusA family protein [Ciceribacter sp. L1K23]
MTDGTTTVYDLRGLKCPLPVLKTKRRLARMADGELLTVETSDPLAAIDIPHFCREHGHSLVQEITTEGGHRFTIRRGMNPHQEIRT